MEYEKIAFIQCIIFFGAIICLCIGHLVYDIVMWIIG